MTLKVIIAGGRDYEDASNVAYELDCLYRDANYNQLEVVCGMAPGADSLGERWAVENGIAIKEFPADWQRYGNRAGPIRNREMAEYADVLVAFWDGESPGTRSMINLALAKGLEVHVYRYGYEPNEG